MKLPFKRLLAALLAALTLLALAGCGSSGKTDAAPKDYTRSSTTPARMRTTSII